MSETIPICSSLLDYGQGSIRVAEFAAGTTLALSSGEKADWRLECLRAGNANKKVS